jgi:hypothetical protein
MKEPLNTDKFVKNLMESMYGKDSMGDIDVPEAPNNDEIVVQHAKQLGDDFGLPTNLGNAWNPGKMVAEAHKKDHDEKNGKKELKGDQAELDVDGDGEIEGEDLAKLRAGKKKEEVMESRVEALEESLKTLLESLQTLISEGYGGGKKMMKEDEKGNVSMNPGKKFIEKREKLKNKPKTVKVQGQDVNVANVASNLDDTTTKGRQRKKELEMKATAQKLDDKKPRKGGQALSKKEMAELTKDAKK